jgi:peptidoglycan/LPS O-acetylase OafA/YrhL
MSSALPTLVEDAREEVVPAPSPAPSPHPRLHQHMPSLDGLRGVAILLVLVHHFSASMNAEFSVNQRFAAWAELGWTGVDLFFVLSGFLITGILYDSRHKPNFFKNFYARRALRIFPLYYTALVLVILMTPLLVRLELQGTANPAWISIYATNFVISWKGAGAFGVLDHFWSLAVEEHFYFVWPAVVFFLSRKKVMMVAVASFLIAPALRILTMDGGAELPVASYMATPMRMDSLAAGAFIAMLVRGPSGMKNLVRPAMILACMAFVVFFSMVLFRNSKSHQDLLIGTMGLSVLWVFFSSVLILALNWKPLESTMKLPVLRWFGKYSYGLYVWHPIIFMLIFHNDVARHIRLGDGPLPEFVSGALALTIMFAVTLLSWHLWEKQFLKFKHRFD